MPDRVCYRCGDPILSHFVAETRPGQPLFCGGCKVHYHRWRRANDPAYTARVAELRRVRRAQTAELRTGRATYANKGVALVTLCRGCGRSFRQYTLQNGLCGGDWCVGTDARTQAALL